MINGFPNVCRLDAAKLLLAKKSFSLSALIEDVVAEMVMTVSIHEFKLDLDQSIMLTADKDKIWSVITNLVSNAVKYSPRGKTVELTSKMMGNRTQVPVRDHGIGLTAFDKEKIFDRYFRVENSNTQHVSGFGISLYLSAEIIPRHGGEIWVERESGKGSIFYFTLPL